MSAALTLAGPEHFERLDALVEAFHAEEDINLGAEARAAGLKPLLDGIPHGDAYLNGPPRAPIGYVIVTLGWSDGFGGMDGFVDEFWIREKVRGRGMGGEALVALIATLRDAGVQALHLEVAADNGRASRLYTRAGFRRRPYNLMTWTAP